MPALVTVLCGTAVRYVCQMQRQTSDSGASVSCPHAATQSTDPAPSFYACNCRYSESRRSDRPGCKWITGSVDDMLSSGMQVDINEGNDARKPVPWVVVHVASCVA